MVDKVHFSSESDLWETPQWLYDELDAEFSFSMDAACTEDNCKANGGYFYDKGDDALVADWVKYGTHWCNPPYSRGNLIRFVAKAAEERLKGVTSVFLIPSRTDTCAWHNYIWDKDKHCPREGVEVRLLKGRLKFEKDGKPVLDKNGKPQSAPFPSAVVIFRGENK